MQAVKAMFIGALGAALASMAIVAGAADDAVLAKVVASPTRTEAQKARDVYRRPAEALAFWGLEPGMTILEVQPGNASYWTEILAPYARQTGGKFYVTGPDVAGAKDQAAAAKSKAAAESQLAAREADYGKVSMVGFGAKSAALPADTFDLILTARSVHGWRIFGMSDKAFKDLYDALKPGGVLALEQHRANPGTPDPQQPTGYLTEASVIEQAERAGFRLVAKSEINANPKDTKDHPFGVWTLPPTRVTVPYGSGKPADPNFDHTKYDAIGESDRMTLKFTKPKN